MTSLALALVLIAAVLHPAWNLLAKRASGGDQTTFVWLTSALSAAMYVPVVIAVTAIGHQRLHNAIWVDLGMMAGTGVLHQIYFFLLQRSYRASEFSLVYPVARGTAPMITAVVALAVFGERLALLQVAGVAIIVVAIFIIAGGNAGTVTSDTARLTLRRSLGYGFATAVSIAAYTLWDKQAVSVFAISPVLYDAGRTASQTLLMAPAVLLSNEKRIALRRTWGEFRREAFGVALLSPLAYLLILYALTTAPVSLVAPLRESSIIIGACMGALFFGEGQLRRRIVAASLMLFGIVLLARG